MAKRSATTPLESPRPSKKQTTVPELQQLDTDFRAAMAARREKPLRLDFEAELDADFRRLVREAVAAALEPERRQPVVLELEDQDVGDSVQYAYVPRTRELGEWLLQALELLSFQAPARHSQITTLIHDTHQRLTPLPDAAAVFQGLPGADNIRSLADLGQFRLVLFPEEDASEVSDAAERFVHRTTLSFALYQQKCQYESGHGGDGDDDDDIDESEDSKSG